MKIVFICSSLEPGKDGIGDYTRKLAGELIKLNYKISIIALNDRYINENYIGEYSVNKTSIPFLRFSHYSNWIQRIKKTKEFIELTQPDWISLQYVPYSFNIKGLPFHLPGLLKKITGKYKWHFMLHEMWVGISKQSPVQHKFYGFFQKLIMHSLLKKVQPKLIHTSNLLYQKLQKKAGISSELLPLFSNIDVYNLTEEKKLSIFKELNIFLGERNKWIIIGIFGHMYSTKNVNTCIQKEYETANENNKTILVISFGKTNTDELSFLKILKKEFPLIRTMILGERSEEDISVILQMIDKGISFTTYELLGKSGAYAAMRRHNVPVLVPKNITMPTYEKSIVQYNEMLDKKLANEWSGEFVSNKFAHDLLHLNEQL